MEIIECREHEPIDLPIERLLADGELLLDPRIESRGYIDATIKAGRLRLRSTRFVGLIPLARDLAIRIEPKASVENLSHFLARSGEFPAIVTDFSRGYRPKFEKMDEVERVFCNSLLAGLETVLERGLLKHYAHPTEPPKWRGRLLMSKTVQRYYSRGIRYNGVFESPNLSVDIPENIALKEALICVREWLQRTKPSGEELRRADRLLAQMATISVWRDSFSALAEAITIRAEHIPYNQSYYKEPLWTSYAILQGVLPEFRSDKLISLDSLVIDVSRIFEGFTRTLVVEAMRGTTWQVVDGNKRPLPFFTDNRAYSVKPDILIQKERKFVGVIDAKYKLGPKENDRYEVLSFMEAAGVSRAAFVCPSFEGHEHSTYLGRTTGDREFVILRIDMAAKDIEREENKFIANVRKFLEGDYSFDA